MGPKQPGFGPCRATIPRAGEHRFEIVDTELRLRHERADDFFLSRDGTTRTAGNRGRRSRLAHGDETFRNFFKRRVFSHVDSIGLQASKSWLPVARPYRLAHSG